MQESIMIYKPEELMPLLRLSRNTIYELLRSGQIRSVKIGKRYLIPKNAIIEFLNGPSQSQYHVNQKLEPYT